MGTASPRPSASYALRSEGWSSYLTAAQRRPALPEIVPSEQRACEQLLDRVREAAAVLKARFGVWRVVLFGSLAHAAGFCLVSLAVKTQLRR